jgi:hypothetical protein
MDMGLCAIFTELRGAPVPVPPYGSCPETFPHTKDGVPVQVQSPERPLGFFKPRNKRAGVLAGAEYDKIMSLAMGRKP